MAEVPLDGSLNGSTWSSSPPALPTSFGAGQRVVVRHTTRAEEGRTCQHPFNNNMRMSFFAPFFSRFLRKTSGPGQNTSLFFGV